MSGLKEKAISLINLEKLDYTFKHPPLLVSGVAMMYHGLRESNKDIDMILPREDHKMLTNKLKPQAKVLQEPHQVGYKETPEFVNLFGDHGILIYEYELWDSIMLFDYDELKEGAIGEDGYLVISLEKLLFLSTIRGTVKERYLDDALLIANKISDEKYTS